jgi:hypothetical protein
LIAEEMSGIPVAHLGVVPFSQLAIRQEREGELRSRLRVMQIYKDFTESATFDESLRSFRMLICSQMKAIEMKRQTEYQEFVDSQNKRIDEELKTRYTCEREIIGKAVPAVRMEAGKCTPRW